MTQLWTAFDLTEATGGDFATPFDATGVSIDTRTLQPGDLFIALLGEGRDGHDFVLDALATACAEDGRWEVLFVAPPLPLTGAVGSPLNPLAIR